MISVSPSTQVKEILRDPMTGQPQHEASRELKREIFKQVLGYGLPSMTGFIVTSFNEMVSMFWLAKIGSAPVAAVTMFMSIFWVLATVNILIGIGSVGVISRRFGEKDIPRTERAIKSTMLLKLGLGTLSGLLGFLILGWSLRFMGAASDVFEMAIQYGVIMLPFSGVFACAFSIFTFFRCIGSPKISLWMQLVSAGTNLILDPFLIFGWGPFPELGVRGAAIAAVTSYTLVVIIGCWYLSRKDSPVVVKWFSRPFPTIKEQAQILRIGWPGGINTLSFSVAMAVAVKLVAVYGTEVVAIYGAANKVLHFGFMSMAGFALGTSALLGQFLGSRELLKAWMVGAQAIRISGWIMFAYGLVIFSGASFIIRQFFSDPAMHLLGTQLMRIMAISMPLIGMHIGAETAFEGAGMNTPPMVLSLIHSWLMVVPFMYILGPWLDFGPHGLMWGWTSAHAIGGVAAIWLFQRGWWLKHEI
jgi:putative MATE family efflux protein